MGRGLIMGMRTCALLALLPVQALAAGQDEDDERFGRAGQVVISSGAELAVRHVTSYEINHYRTEILVAPAADVFVVDGFSVGGQLLARVAFEQNASYPGFGLGPRIGYGAPLSDKLSFHGTLGATYVAERDGWGRSETLTVDLFAPLLVHPAPHFFVGLGPHVAQEISTLTVDPRYTTYELRSVIGGYF